MIYHSNLIAPDLSLRFKLKDPPITIMGHDMPSDPDYEPNCGYWTHDEAAILYHCAARVGGRWLDIGSRFGWTGAHIMEGTQEDVWCLDPMYEDYERMERAFIGCPQMIPIPRTSQDFFETYNVKPGFHFDGIVIDGCHDAPEPLRDGTNAALLSPKAIMYHDFQGKPVRDGVTYLMNLGWQCRVYNTPNGVAVLWRDGFVPPVHVPDPAINWAQVRAQYTDFDYSRTV